MRDVQSNGKAFGYWSLFAIGVGGMVGGGIFAVLGLAVQLAHGGTPIAFSLAGLVAIITSYSYARLSVAYPSEGGTVEFLNRAFGPGIITGGLNVLLWLSYIVMLSLYAYAFGSYASSYFSESVRVIWKHVLISAIIIAFTVLNALGASAVGRAERWIVATKVAILLFFIVVGLWSVNFDNLHTSQWAGSLSLVSGGMIIFVAYEGFELIANAAKDTRNPKKTLPLAYYSSVLFVVLLYVLISIVTVGNLSIDRIVAARDYTLAEAAIPFLGTFGFTLITIAALLSTSSAINATLFGSARISYIIAKEGELPRVFEKRIWNRPLEGLLLTSILTLFVANLFNLTSISMMGSAGFLLIFAAVNISNVRLAGETQGRRWISAIGATACVGAIVALLAQTAGNSPENLLVFAALLITAFSIEVVYRRFTGRTMRCITE